MTTYVPGSVTVGSKFWALVRDTIPGVGLKLQISARDWGIAPLTELNGEFKHLLFSVPGIRSCPSIFWGVRLFSPRHFNPRLFN